MTPLPFKPLIILGAGRSGTNALRDALTNLDGVETWPCDEINPIWRHGNLRWPTDEIPPERATLKVQRFIRDAFIKQWQATGKPEILVEKTCANSLRVPFIAKVFPEAVFLHIVRDGRDVVPSAKRRWQGRMEMPSLPYFIAKARYVPLMDLPFYGTRYLGTRIRLILKLEERLRRWGPIHDGMFDGPIDDLDLVCARQWAACVIKTSDALDEIPASKAMTLHYEDFVASPEVTISNLLEKLGQTVAPDAVSAAVSHINSNSVGRDKPKPDGPATPVQTEMAPALGRHGYLF
ncbi:sulfotransferase [bacterium]|nr:sulfotransferase [bacterium]